MFFSKKEAQDKLVETEKVANRLHRDNLKQIDDATKTNKRLLRLLEADGITLKIFIALGGDKNVK